MNNSNEKDGINTKKQQHRFTVLHTSIPFQGIMENVDNYHVYDEHKDGTSTLLGVFKYMKHANHFKNYLEQRK